MDEYIKKNQALCCFSGWTDQFGDFHEPDEMIEYQRIEQLTAADVVPVVHGYWRHYEGMLYCSECGTEFYDDIMEYCGDNVPHFCPNCGAKMDRKDGDHHDNN